ncbi:hypothetical protein DBV05_g10462 [Lasiodiplodia theobromae]|uniref:Uncharacterized protein n=1 Tax=Lasiodiplodia theobromae TaxID=45133 RepID=A0A5N5CZS8_9PEZI|nr:hypothetical protein DBV05_g10462 [Lasiodiplodia theobromae]
MLEMQEDETQNNFAPEFYGWVTHPIFAFSPRLINPLLKIGRNLRLQTWQAVQPPSQESMVVEAHPNVPKPPVAEDAQILSLEEELRLARDGDTETEAHRISSSGDGGSDNAGDPMPLVCLNEAMHAAARILIDSRLRRLPFTAPSIREHVNRVVCETSKITDASRVSHALAFPLFVAGCEAVDTAARETIASRLVRQRGLLFNPPGYLVKILRRVWGIRDADPGLDWTAWTSEISHDFCYYNLF